MRVFVMTGMMCFASALCAQSSVDMLKGSSDAGQRAFDQRIAPAAGSSQTIHTESEVEVTPLYPGGMEALNKALLSGCDTSQASSGTDCNEDFRYTVRFVVERDGTVTNPEVIGAVDCPILVNSTVCRVSQLQRFRPGTINGAPVRTRLELGSRYTTQ